ncbi:unnamed protein product [Adineta ricciae]|uniref:Bicarbonate transporter-like transmembrane domain-containing protein n=1 Tax=Adineta ricciae TaxID=249248 RepID=A0A815FKF4_ADIRI|nr:unnamed protein product [Adineta ricciae]CAF1330602.1 unnamed protein product [Adineta ricciae]
MHRTDSSFRRHAGGGSLRRFSFRRKPTRESVQEPTSTWSFNSDTHEWQLLRDDGAQIQLVYNKSEHIPLKDFAAEIRGGKDIKEFLLSALVLLDVQDTSIWDLLEIILRRIKQTSVPHNGGASSTQSSSLPTATTTMISNTVISSGSSGHRENLNIDEIKQALFVNDRVRILAKTLQATTATETNWTYDQSWLAIMCTSPSIVKRHVAIARLKNPCNLGRNCQEARFIVFILSPMKEKGTKNFLETGRTFATIFADIELRAKLLKATTQQEFISIIDKHTDNLMEQQTSTARNSFIDPFDDNTNSSELLKVKTYYCPILSDICLDFSRRLPHYLSDYYDIFKTHRGSNKVISTAVFLYFACLLPSIAFGVLNSQVTNDQISVSKAVASQCLGGLFFSIFAGQPLIVVMTTAPLTLYVKVISILCAWYRTDFRDTYALVGLWNSFFLILFSFFGVSKVMKWSTRSTEEIFALFVSIAFLVDASAHVYQNFAWNYSTTACKQYDEYWKLRRMNKTIPTNLTGDVLEEPCSRDSSLLYLLLTLGTVWLGTFLYKFKQTPYLTSAKRELLADYALPVAVIIMSLIGSLLFNKINLQSFPVDHENIFVLVRFKNVTLKQILATGGLGFSLSLLMFLDQNIAGAIVNSPANKLKKGKAFHIDLFVIAILNGWLSLFGLTWMHGALPLSPLHVKALADTEERVEQGHIQSVIVKVRETRLTVLLSHIFIGLSLFMRDILKQIPMPVLDGLFLYLALTSLDGNQFFERVTLFFTEQAAYPPNHYIRQVPQRKIHLFTFFQVLQLLILCFLGFSPILYTKLVLPIWLVAMVAFRYRILPKLIPLKYLRSLDQRL